MTKEGKVYACGPPTVSSRHGKRGNLPETGAMRTKRSVTRAAGGERYGQIFWKLHRSRLGQIGQASRRRLDKVRALRPGCAQLSMRGRHGLVLVRCGAGAAAAGQWQRALWAQGSDSDAQRGFLRWKSPGQKKHLEQTDVGEQEACVGVKRPCMLELCRSLDGQR
jgi:hypothetical protein